MDTRRRLAAIGDQLDESLECGGRRPEQCSARCPSNGTSAAVRCGMWAGQRSSLADGTGVPATSRPQESLVHTTSFFRDLLRPPAA